MRAQPSSEKLVSRESVLFSVDSLDTKRVVHFFFFLISYPIAAFGQSLPLDVFQQGFESQ